MKALLVVLALVFPATSFAQIIRPLSTDRPDRTESPYSVPQGWLQIESDLVTVGELETETFKITGLSVMTLNIKYGLSPRLDVQGIFNPYVRFETEVPGLPSDVTSGTGQAGLRLKFNVVGNDIPGTALALLPFAYIPTRGDALLDQVTWGIMVPFGFDIGGDRSLGVMTGVTRVNNEDTWVTGSIAFGTPIAGDLSGFLEVFVTRSGLDDNALDDTTLDAGFTFAPSRDLQFDLGVYKGLTDTSEDWRVFFGAAARWEL